jgi:signal transduction histidine kinase
MNLRWHKKKEQRNLLTAFIGGSLIFIVVCLSITSILFAYKFIEKERQRAQISREQVAHFFAFQYSNMAEEMWTRNLEAIATRIGFIAREMGNAEYDFVLSDEAGNCLLQRSRDGATSPQCELPQTLRTMVNNPPKASEWKPTPHFDEKTHTYLYMAPLYVGSILKGYLYVSLSDPYGFYRGSVFAVAVNVLLPAISAILVLWLLWLLICRGLFLKPYLASIREMKSNETLAQLASHTAHDMRDPLSWIDKLTASLPEIPEEKRIMIKSAVLQLKDIANGLLSHSKVWGRDKGSPKARGQLTVELISSLVGRVVSEKRIQFKSRPGVQIEAPIDANAYGLFAKVESPELKRVLSNLINNAVEALDMRGLVTITVSSRDESVILRVVDTGKGIPEDVLPQLGVKGATFGKKRGTGLGLFYSKTVVESWGGQLHITSQVGKGTSVEIILPKLAGPVWFVPELKLKSGTLVVLLDDQPSIHQVWRERFESLNGAIQLVHFSHADEFSNWLERQNPTGPVLYLCDYELSDHSDTGLEIIGN